MFSTRASILALFSAIYDDEAIFETGMGVKLGRIYDQMFGRFDCR